MHELYELKDMLCKELKEYDTKGELTAGSLDVVDKLTSSDLSAYLDLSTIEEAGSQRLKVNVKCDEHVYFRVEMQKPEDLPVSVYTKEPASEAEA